MINRLKSDLRFFGKIKFPNDLDECWLWIGASTTDGYGHLRRAGTTIPTHRYSFALCYGYIDDTLMCLHTCDNPKCVNPNHLYLGTNKDNCRDRSERKEDKEIHLNRLKPGEIWLLQKLVANSIHRTIIMKIFKCSLRTVNKYAKSTQSWLEG